MKRNVRILLLHSRIVLIAMAVAFLCPFLEPAAAQAPDSHETRDEEANGGIGPIKALVLGDSMSLCGFGDTFTSYLQKSGMCDEVHMYMASGTNPLSWLSHKSYKKTGTRSGFWVIHQTAEGREQLKDVYGMRAGYRPGYHRVPKLEALLEEHRPQVLIVQLGSNLYDLFPTKTVVTPDGKRIRQRCVTANGMKALPGYLKPFLAAVLQNGGFLKNCYWIAPPECGLVHPELADAVYQVIKKELSPVFDVFDSRDVTSYPYKSMGSDGIHFWGNEATLWGIDTFSHLECTLPQKHEFVSIPSIHQLTEIPVEDSLATGGHDGHTPVELRLLLQHRPEIISIVNMHPYRNQIAVYDYQIVEGKGSFAGKKLRVIHPVVLDLQLSESATYNAGMVLEGQFVPFDPTSSAATWPRTDDYDFATFSEESAHEYISLSDLELIAAAESEMGVKLEPASAKCPSPEGANQVKKVIPASGN